MINKKTFFTGFVLMLLCSTFVYSGDSNYNKIFKQTPYQQLNAKVMSVNLKDNSLFIAEQTVKLSIQVDKKGVSHCLTKLIDSSGRELSISDFKPKDRVLVEGIMMPDDTIVANSITKKLTSE